MKLFDELNGLLAANKNEPPFQKYFERHPYQLLRIFNKSWNYFKVFPQWRLGTQYVADFLIISGDSGYWRSIFIEIESPSSRLYLKNGSKSKKLRVAEKQLEDWKAWLEGNREFFRQEVLRKLGDKPCYGYDVPDLKLSKTHIFDEWKLIIGRRGDKNDSQRQASRLFGSYEIATYDRFLECAKMADDSNSDDSKPSKT